MNNYSDANTLYFQVSLHPSQFKSSNFYITSSGVNTLVYFKDVPDAVPMDYNGTGTLRLYNAITNALITSNYGAINYLTGAVVIPSLIVTGYPNGISDIRLNGELQEASYDIFINKQQILMLDTSSANVNAGISEGVSINVTKVIE